MSASPLCIFDTGIYLQSAMGTSPDEAGQEMSGLSSADSPADMDPSEAQGQVTKELRDAMRSRSAFAGHVTRIIQQLNMALVEAKNKGDKNFVILNCINQRLVEAHRRFDDSHAEVIKHMEEEDNPQVIGEADAYKDKVEVEIKRAYKRYEEYVLDVYFNTEDKRIGSESNCEENMDKTSTSVSRVGADLAEAGPSSEGAVGGNIDSNSRVGETRNLLDPEADVFVDGKGNAYNFMSVPSGSHNVLPSSGVSQPVVSVAGPSYIPSCPPNVLPPSGVSQPVVSGGVSNDLCKLIEMLQLPKAELQNFDGDPLKYWSFVRSFDGAVGQTSVSTRAKLIRLLQCCEGRALKAIEACNLMDADRGYTRALQILYERFGNLLHLKEAWLKRVTDGPNLKGNDKIGLRDLADDVRNCYETLHACNQSDCGTPEKAMLVVKRLPFHLQNQYRKEAMKYTDRYSQYPGLGMLADFLDQAARQANDPLFSILNETNESKNQNKRKENVSKASFNTQVKSASSSDKLSSNVGIECSLCKDSHHLYDCSTFKSYKPDGRLAFVRKHRLCFNCLISSEHRVHNCDKSHGCVVRNCKLWHHSLLHEALDYGNNKQGEEKNVKKSYASSPGRLDELNKPERSGSDKVCLPIVKVKVRDVNHHNRDTLALLDPGSTGTFCTKSLLRELGLQGDCMNTRIDTVNPGPATNVELTPLEISGKKGKQYLLSNVCAVDTIPGMGNSVATRTDIDKWSHLSDLPIPIKVREEVKLIIGLDNPHLLKPYEIRVGEDTDGEPYAVRYALGWAIHGPVGTDENSKIPMSNFIHSERVMHSDDLLCRQVERFWAVDGVEDLGTDNLCMSKEDKEVIKLWDESVKRVNGNYQLPIPFKLNPPELCNNRCMVENRQDSLRKRLMRNPELLKQYDNEIQALTINGYAELVPGKEVLSVPGLTWYLPVFNVKNPRKPDKFRLVFDCAATYRGQSLNNQVKQGPDLVNKLFGVLARFRKGTVGVMADIQAMFYQVSVTPDHRNALRFLWWPNGDLGKLPVEYRMTRHLFGGVWSPCAATYALRHCAESQRNDDNAHLVDSVNRDFYVDDLLHSEDSSVEVLQFKDGITKLLDEGGFKLTKWASNSEEVRASFHEREHVEGIYPLNFEDKQVEHALGLQWDTRKDLLSIRVVNKEGPYTRRGLLSILASVYDPLGMVSPVVVIAKLIFQAECRQGKTWDEKLSERNMLLWRRWLADLHHLDKFSIPRCIKPLSFSKDFVCSLHHFCDASQSAYGVVSYLRLEDKDNNVHCTFITSKSRLAPMKTLSIPRLELSAAVLAVKVDELVRNEMDVSVNASIFWTDSMLVLQYIGNHYKRFKVFVANRVARIQRSTEVSQWRHVPSQQNPADDVSRGMSATQLASNQRWVRGPEYLWQPQDRWPRVEAVANLLEDDVEVNKEKAVISLASNVGDTKLDELLLRFSSWHKLTRAVCWIKRFISWAKVKWLKVNDGVCVGSITTDELKDAESKILSYLQSKYYSNEIKILKSKGGILPKTSSIYRLEPFLECGLLRVSGRLQHSPVSHDLKHQIILPRQHHIATIIARKIHVENGHSGREGTMAAIRRRYWIPKARPLVNRIIRRCVICTRYKGSNVHQRMADMPEDRLIPGKPAFSSVGVDCFGHFLVKRGRSHEKRYGCLFTCFTTRGVHIEMLNNLDADSFINALNRFMCRRGIPDTIRSDNGTNFVGAYRELLVEFDKVQKSAKVQNHLLTKGLKWEYNPPYASHMGGVWERMIRSVRNILNVFIRNQVLDDERLSTVFCEIESILNSRPLVPLSNDPIDLEPLTPNHLLLLRPGCDVPLAITMPKDQYGRRWRHVQLIADKFWERWLNEYLCTIQLRTKWLSVGADISIGDLVVINNPNTPRYAWPLGRVIEKYEGKDGLTRTVKLRTATGEVVRPVAKLCLLEGVNQS